MRARLRAIAATGTLCLVMPAGVVGQLVVERPTGELAVDLERATYSYPDGVDDGRRTLREWLLFRSNGYVSDPRIASFDVALRPLLGQRSWTGPLPSPDGSIQRLDGRVSLSLLSGAPVSVQAEGLRARDDQTLRYGAEQAFDLTTWRTRLDWTWRPLPVWLEYRDESRRLIDRPDPETVRPRDEAWRTLRLGARNSKTRLNFERMDYENRIGATDFVQNRFDADHRIRWGKGSRLTSMLQYLDRTGSGAVERQAWQQRARLLHTPIVSSDLGYTLSDQSSSTDFRRGWEADYTASWTTSNRVQLLAEGRTRDTKFRLGSQSYSRVGARAVVGARLAERVDLRAAAGAGYEWHEQVVSEEGTGVVVDERHVVGPAGSFFLREPYPREETVVIKSEDATLVYEPGFDYRLVPTGATLEVVILPGGRIGTGEVVLTDYAFRLLPGGSANAWVYDYELTASAGPVSLYHRRYRQTEPGDGPPTPIASLRERDDITLGVRLSGVTSIGTVSLSAQYDDRSARTFDFSGFHVRGGWGVLLAPSVRGSISGGRTSRTNGSEYAMWDGEARLEWDPARGLRLVGRLSGYDWVEVDDAGLAPRERRERFLGGGVGVEWRIRKLIVGARFDRNVWTQGFERTEDRVYLRVAREF